MSEPETLLRKGALEGVRVIDFSWIVYFIVDLFCLSRGGARSIEQCLSTVHYNSGCNRIIMVVKGNCCFHFCPRACAWRCNPSREFTSNSTAATAGHINWSSAAATTNYSYRHIASSDRYHRRQTESFHLR